MHIQLANRIRNLQHTVNLPEAIRLGLDLQQMASSLRSEVDRVFADTNESGRQANQLLARAKRIKQVTVFLFQKF